MNSASKRSRRSESRSRPAEGPGARADPGRRPRSARVQRAGNARARRTRRSGGTRRSQLGIEPALVVARIDGEHRGLPAVARQMRREQAHAVRAGAGVRRKVRADHEDAPHPISRSSARRSPEQHSPIDAQVRLDDRIVAEPALGLGATGRAVDLAEAADRGRPSRRACRRRTRCGRRRSPPARRRAEAR